MTAVVRLACAVALAGLALPGATLGTSTTTMLAAALVVVVVTAVRAQPGALVLPPTPAGCAARGRSMPPPGRLHQLDPDAAGHPRPRAPGRRKAATAA